MESLQQYLDKPVFTTCFKYNDVGRLDFGDIQTSLYTGLLTEVPVNNGSGAWLLDNLWFEVNGQPIGVTTPTSLTVGWCPWNHCARSRHRTGLIEMFRYRRCSILAT